MKLVLPGGSGHIGTLVAQEVTRLGHEVVVLTRRPDPAPWRVVAWDGRTLDNWCHEIDGATVVLNLAGRSVNCRYTEANRREITSSRVDSTRAVGEAIRQANQPPRVWLQMSTATLYAHRYDAPNDEATGILGGEEPGAPDTWRFSIDVAKRWEAAALECETPGTRKVLLRSAMVMSADRGGIFDTLLGLVRCGLGGTAGSGEQYVSWIHEADFLRSLWWLLQHETLAGPVNLAAPNPLPNRELMRTLRQAWGIPIGLPATNWMLEIGARVLKTETELILKSRRVTPGRLLQSGFEFQFPHWAEAAQDLCRTWRNPADRPA